MATDIIPLEEFIAALQEKAEEEDEDLYILKGDRVSEYGIKVNDDKGVLQIGSIGWSQESFKNSDDARTLMDMSSIMDATLLVPEKKLSEEAIGLTKQQTLDE